MIPPTARAAPDPIEEILRRIAAVESDGMGGYTARGPLITSGAYRGQRAAGKYQIMPGNLPAWSREALGREVALDEFLSNSDIQERIARHRVGEIYRQYPRVEDVASVWHSGRPLARAGGARDQNMTTREYVRRVAGEQESMDPELERLERALRAAHAAGDEPAARRLAAALVERRGAPSAIPPPQARSAPPILLDEEGQPVPGQTREDDTLARLRMETGGVGSDDAENTIRLSARYDSTAPAAVAEPAGPIGLARAKWERDGVLTPEEARTLGFGSPEEALGEWEAEAARVRGRASVRPEDREGFNAAAVVQGFGSGLFGVGTPATAVGEMLVSRLDGEPGASTWNESLAFARGRRDQLRESHPQEFYGGMAGSLLSGAGAMRGLGVASRATLPRAASVFTMQSGQTAKNIARLSAAGAGAAGVTALNEEGVDAVVPAAVAGGVAGPALAGAGSVALGGARAVVSRIKPDNAAIRLLAKRLGEPVDALQARYTEFVQTRGRPPRLAEIVQQRTSEEFGQISRARSEAGEVFRRAEEEAARALPDELAPLVRAGGPVGSEPAAAARRAATAATAADVVNRRVQSSVVRQVGVKGTRDGGQRGRSMDALMGRIGDHRVPITDQMMEVVEDPDLMGALEPAVRRGVRRAIEAAGEGETPYLRVRDWDTIRRELGRRAKTENGRRYTQLRDDVRDYVSGAVPEYAAGLREFGRRSDTARGAAEGARILTRTTREFADRLRAAGSGGVPEKIQGAVVNYRGQDYDAPTHGQAVEAIEQATGKFQDYLANMDLFRTSTGRVVSREEALDIAKAAQQWNGRNRMRLEISGRPGLFAEALKNSTPTSPRAAEMAGVRVGARTALANALGGDPAKAERFMETLARDAGLRARVRLALRDDEVADLERLAERYGLHLEMSEGMRIGRGILQQKDDAALTEAVNARRTRSAGVRQGARAALTEAAGESPAGAARTALRMAEDPGLQARIATALGAGEQRRLAALGRSAVESSRRMAEAAPGGAQLAAVRAQENAEGIQRVIQAVAVMAKPAGGGFLSNLAYSIMRSARLPRAASQRLAELAVDPARAHEVIARLRRAGVESGAILRMYQDAATAAGIMVGRAGDTPEPIEP